MKNLNVLLVATLIIPCSLLAQLPIATFEGDELRIPSLTLGNQNYKDIVVKYLGGMSFDVTQIRETAEPIVHSSSKFESGKLVVNVLALGDGNYADLQFDYAGGTSLNLSSFKGPVKDISFKQTEFLLAEPKEWKTTEKVYNQNKNAFEVERSDLIVSDFPLMDIDRDGRKDLLILGSKWDGGFVDEAVRLRWLRNTGDGFELGDSSVFPESSAKWLLRYSHVADFNNDGMDDFFGVDTGYDGLPFPGGENLLLLSQNDGSFKDVGKSNELFNYKGFTHGLAVGDVNNDGSLDIVTTDTGGIDANASKTSLRILINDGTGNFSLSSSFQNLSAADEPWYDYGATSLSLIDLDDDGFLDLVIGALQEKTKDRIYWNDSRGEFSTTEYTILPDYLDSSGSLLGSSMFILGTDLDFDGDRDLIISKTNKFYRGKGVQFIKNHGDKIFSDVTEIYSPLANSRDTEELDVSFYLKEIDVNMDGLPDLKFNYDKERYFENGISKVYSHVWLKKRDGSYEELPEIILNQKGWFWLIDYDEDGDIGIINRSSRSQKREGEESYLSDEIFEWRILENQSL